MSKPLRYYSKRYSVSAANGQEITIPADEFPLEGPTGGRLVADYYVLYVSVQADFSIGAQDGRDNYRFIQQARVVETDGLHRINLRGDELRVMNYGLLGPEKMTELADNAVANNSTFLLAAVLPMEKPKTVRPRDFSHGIDELRHIVVNAPTAATASGGVATIVIDSYEIYVVAWCHEEHDLQFHAKDVLKSEEFGSATQAKLQVDGKLQDLYIWTPGAGGGASQANFTSLRIDTASMLDTSLKTELLAEYRLRRGVSANRNGTNGGEHYADPFVDGKAIPVLISDEETSCFDGVYLKQVRLDCTSSVASNRALMRITQPANPATRNRIAANWGVADWGAVKVKTLGKTQRDLTDWPEPLRAWLPLKVATKRAV